MIKLDDLPIIIANGVVEVVRQSGADLLLTGGELYLYREGVWRLAGSGDIYTSPGFTTTAPFLDLELSASLGTVTVK